VGLRKTDEAPSLFLSGFLSYNRLAVDLCARLEHFSVLSHRRSAVSEKKVLGSPEAVTEEATSQTVSLLNSQDRDLNLRKISSEVLEEKIVELEKQTWYKNRKGHKVDFGGQGKDVLVGVFRDSHRLLDGSLSGMYELGEFFHTAKHRIGHDPAFVYWLKFLKIEGPGKWLVRVFEKYGSRLDQFAHLGLKKLWLAAKLDDCVGFVERHEETIAAQPEEELDLLIQRVLAIEPKAMILDSNANHADMLRTAITGLGCRVETVDLKDIIPGSEKNTAQLIIQSNPDLLIMNALLFSGSAIKEYSALAIYKWLPRMPNIPVIFYITDESIETLSAETWLRLISFNPLALLRTPFRDQEIKAAVNSALRVIKAEKQLQWAYEDLEAVVASRTAQLSTANEQLLNEVRARTKAEQSAVESKRQLQAVFDCALDSIFIKDRERAYRTVNPAMAQFLGLEESEMVGKSDEDFFEKDVADHFRELDQRVLKGETIEEEYCRPVGGVKMTFLDSRVPLKNPSGEIVGICGISRDVTERTGVVLDKLPVDHDYSSPAMHACMENARVAAESDSIVLLLGESGSGKDYLARYIHNNSKRRDGPYYSINCSTIPHDMAESELFGHEKGAFTGAHASKRGLLELAEGGTLLLNEIGELPLPLQAKLLTFLDTRKFNRLGAERLVEVNARLIAATNRNLETEVKEGGFRTDLFYRINVLSITVPSLRDRREDICTLVQQMVPKLCEDLQLPAVPVITRHAMEALTNYHWPGNVRELRNVLERALIVRKGARLDVAALGLKLGPHTDRMDASFDVREGYSRSDGIASAPAAPLVMELTDEELKAMYEDVCVLIDRGKRVGTKGSARAIATVIGCARETISRRLGDLGCPGIKKGRISREAMNQLLGLLREWLFRHRLTR
jgi:PAS domain S-box-containing protein